MKHSVRQFKNLAIALKEMKPFIQNGNHLRKGRGFENFGGMRSREILCNWLLCVTANAVDGTQLIFCSDEASGSDGVIYDLAKGDTFPTEHVMVPPAAVGAPVNGEALILKAIAEKCAKGGKAYASGKTLVVFNESGAGAWKPNRIARQLPKPLHFAAVWVVGLQGVENGSYVYGVANLDLSRGDAPAFRVCISPDFDSWDVTTIQ
jgi:hypothetical protein